MKVTSITEAKNSLSALIGRLKAGSAVLIVERGRPVARLEPVAGSAQDKPDGRLLRLIRDGLARPRRSAPPLALFRSEPPRPRPGRSAVDALLQERREGL